ncbi:hypothetical protein CAPTEDRAFT_178155 [Capitella teleta]|uniref:E3 ubiquitin-protein ligase RNF10 n=1 Tax=Capitella teleta TaxID=283909 RepID=R7UJV5_CAPTE|nr:hypothetical protein CAPTEDRAFT_178155 [Capitella teleta]|eukprot:ELU04068.1 hypothetical protein CAPTEDRAFT_178155 [Capitella teleta]
MSQGTRGEGNSPVMDKKPTNRQSSVPPAKASGAKKDNGKKLRYKRKDFGGIGNSANGRVLRGDSGAPPPKPGASRPRYDKRPRSRGDNTGNQSEEVGHKDRAEDYGPVESWGPKKGNLNHLLNFRFEPLTGGGGAGSRRGGARGRGRGRGFKGSWYNKERFLQANCQFIVRASGDYAGLTVEPDSLVDWDLIEQVRLFTHEVVSCPICLYPPTAAKITRCGHIYCWTCMLHYLSLDDRHWRKCPICYESVQESDLKSVQPIMAKHYKVADQITLQLMKKPKGSTRVFPVADWDPSVTHTQPGFLDDSSQSKYAKLLLVAPEQVYEMVLMERTALETQKALQETENIEASFIQAALNSVDERLESLARTLGVEEEVVQLMDNLKVDDNDDAVVGLNTLDRSRQSVVTYASAFDDEVVTSDTEEGFVLEEPFFSDSVKASPIEKEVKNEVVEAPLEVELPPFEAEELKGAEAPVRAVAAEAYYFYQAMDGQHIYLHPVNARCLVKEYGGLEHSPPLITASVVALEPVTMDEDLRHRLRYLSHLPLSCEFIVAELALKPPLLSDGTLEFFAVELQRRQKQRQRKDRDERRRDKRIREDENRMYGIDPNTVIVRSTAHNQQSASNYIVPTPALVESTESTPMGSPGSEPLSVGSPTHSDDGGVTSSSALSFAQMLKMGKSSKAVAEEPVVPRPRVRASDSEGDPVEGHVAAPTYQTSFSDAIQSALDSFIKSPGSGSQAVVVDAPSRTTSSGGGGRKKRKVKLLFSTTMNRAK